VPNDKIDFTSAARELNKSAAIIVSGDPYFLSRASTLAPLLTKPVCYPFSEYFTYATKGKTMSFGPDLGAAYEKLGGLAKEVLQRIENGEEIPKVGTLNVANSPVYYQ
jgi:hypothetical protein